MKIIGADERLNEPRGVKIALIGSTGVGKTSQLRTLDPDRVLFVDGEAGDLSVQDVPVDTIRIDDWATARNVAVRIGGFNASFAPTSCYSEAHYKAVGARWKTSTSTTSSSSTALPRSAGSHSAGPSSSRRRVRSARAPGICAAPTACMGARC